MTGSFVLASDIGSSACKTMVLDRLGRVVATARQEYPTSYPQPGWAEQDPDDWYAAFCSTIRAVLARAPVRPDQITGVGVVGVTHNTVLLDDHDRPLCPTILLFDNRSAPQVRAILSRWNGAIRELTLNDITPVWSWPQLLWVREHRPETWRAVRRVLFQKDYVRHRLAPAPVTDEIDAGGSLLFDPIKTRWIEPFCRDLEVEPAWLPGVKHPFEIVSRVGSQGAADTGLLAGTPVITGTTDTVAEMLGSGAIREGSAVVKLASVGRIAVVSQAPVRRPGVLNYRHVLEGLWYPGTASKSAASALRWLRTVLWPDADGDAVYQLMDREAAQVPPGSGGLIFHPHLMGEWAPYWDEHMRGDFIGLTARHTRGHIVRAVLEGVAFALKDALTAMEATGLQARDIRLIGQGSRSALWGRIVANVLNRRLSIPRQADASYGAALITAIGVDAIDRDPDALEAIIEMEARIDPDPDLADDYAGLFAIYRDADAVLRSISARLGAFDHRRARQKADQSA